MTTPFDPNARLVLTRCQLVGPLDAIIVDLALDTGASRTLIRPRFLEAVGLSPSASSHHRRMRSATGGDRVPLVVATHLVALGHQRDNFPVAAYEFPPAVTFDGLLGLDFLRGRVLTLDFSRGRADLRLPRWWRFWP